MNKLHEKEIVIDYINEFKSRFLIENDFGETDLHRYEMILQERHFLVCICDEELELAAKFAIEILEEMKNLNNAGFGRAEFQRIVREVENETADEEHRILLAWMRICNKRIMELIVQVETFRRVGGAYAMFLTRPTFMSVMYAVYDVVVDKFNEEDIYWAGGFFLFRAILMMHSKEIEEG